eukprot:GHRQ01005650.1.p1 GENE.GHRQ01005650.1~~GHRQ01005650.1.p1  ORF type:complete len:137 (+),score=33.36 GHRQ01005650.1:188-598(+)
MQEVLYDRVGDLATEGMDEEAGDKEPLLVADDDDAWNDVEAAPTQLPGVTVRQLIARNPDHVVRFIAKKGVAKLGQFKVQDAVMLAAMDGSPFVTMGSASREIDYEHEWSTYINKLAKRKKGRYNTGESPEVAPQL